jgi:hypothetical protein
MSTPQWSMECDYMESCNCDFGCACNFSGLPNYGFCQGLIGHHIRKGRYGDIVLDGLDFILAAAFPRAIHQGDGVMRIYITQKASPEQFRAIADIVYGRAGGSGPFALFAPVTRYQLEPEAVPIEMRVAGTRSSFSVPGVLNVELSPHFNPVTGEEQEVIINLPKGFIWKTAQSVKTAVMKIVSPHLNFDHAGRNAFYSVVEYSGP